jgi:hypothetical protein
MVKTDLARDAQLMLKTQIPGALRQGFFFIDKSFELSNLDLVKGLIDVVESLVFLIP